MTAREAVESIIRAFPRFAAIDISVDEPTASLGLSGIGLRAHEILYVLAEIERRLGVKIPEADILSGKIGTVGGLLESVSASLHRGG